MVPRLRPLAEYASFDSLVRGNVYRRIRHRLAYAFHGIFDLIARLPRKFNAFRGHLFKPSKRFQ